MPDSLIRFPLATCLIVAFELVDADPDLRHPYSERASAALKDIWEIGRDLSEGSTRSMVSRTFRIVQSVSIASL